MRLLGKGIINREIMPYLHIGKANRSSKQHGMWRVVECILYKLKTGVQWYMLPVSCFFRGKPMPWQSIYYHYRRWCSDGSWERLWNGLMKKYKDRLDLSSTDMDGSHTPCKRGGEQVGYQGRKKAVTSNMILLTGRCGSVIACSEPIDGAHHDCFDIKRVLAKMLGDLRAKGLHTEGLFLNADPGFDSKELRELLESEGIHANIKEKKRKGQDNVHEGYLFDKELYSLRYCIERSNAWVDNFRQLTIRYETDVGNWLGANYLAFTMMFLKNKKIINTYF